MRKRADADYRLLQFHGPPELLEQLDHTLKITDGVIRFRIIKLRPGTPPPPDLSARRVAAAAPGARQIAAPAPHRRATIARSGAAVHGPHPGRADRASASGAATARLRAAAPLCRRAVTPAPPATTLSTNRPQSATPPRVPADPHLDSADNELARRSLVKGALVAATNINRVVLTGNLTRDPELRSLPSGMSVCSLRIACNTRRKNKPTGDWEDKPNFFDVTVWGAQGENCARFLSKGRPVALDGRLEWREWETQDGNKRQAVEIVADAVQFLGGRDDAPAAVAAASRRARDVPVDDRDFQPAGASGGAQQRRRPTTTSRSSRRYARRARSAGRPRAAVPATLSGRVVADALLRARRRAFRLGFQERVPNVAKQRSRPTRRRDRKGGPGSGRRKSCQYCRDKVEFVDYKDVATLRKFISDRGKIRSRRITGACRRHQNQIATAVKRARELALLPYVGADSRDERGRDRDRDRDRGDRDRWPSDAPGHPAPGRRDARRARHGRRRLEGLPAQLPDPAQARRARHPRLDRRRPAPPGGGRARGRRRDAARRGERRPAQQDGPHDRPPGRRRRPPVRRRSRPRTSSTPSRRPAASTSTAARSTSRSRSSPSARAWSPSRSPTASLANVKTMVVEQK